MITLDGSVGEGGGQILRSALSLSMLTGQPFKISNIRAGRAKPGLLRQHLTAVQAAAEIACADVTGAAIGSKELAFKPGRVKPGTYSFAVGTAGSATLVLQTILPPLLTAAAPSKLTVGGGTHNRAAPPFDFLAKAFLPLLARMGARVDATLLRPGFYPAGGGEFTVNITPASKLTPLELCERGAIRTTLALARCAALPRSVGQRELDVIAEKLELARHFCRVEELDDVSGPGNVALIIVESEHVTEVFTGFGEKGTSAEAVANQAVSEAREYLGSGAPVGLHLADQLLLPLAMAGGGVFRTLTPTPHTRTNMDVIRQFLDVKMRTERISDAVWEIVVN
jgi:RNA 3'-terminal phosphate cyclase (ATP)